MAAAAGVSRQTVSRVLNDRDDVALTTRERVQDVIDDLGYRPNLAARGLTQQRTNTIGLVIPYRPAYLFSDPHLLQQMSAVDQVLGQRGYTMLLTTALPDASDDDNAAELSAFERVIQAGYVDGVLICETPSTAEGIAMLEEHEYPWVILGYAPDDTIPHAVHADDRGGARQAIMHLLSLGHQRIGIISAAEHSITAIQERLAGCRLALKEHHLRLDEAKIVHGDFTPESGYRATARLMQQPSPPSAIFALNDRMAVGAIQYLTTHGRRVPQEVAVIGFDDIPMANTCAPSLTTVRQPAVEMGQQATRLLFDLIEDRAASNQPIVLPTELIVRESTGAIYRG